MGVVALQGGGSGALILGVAQRCGVTVMQKAATNTRAVPVSLGSEGGQGRVGD